MIRMTALAILFAALFSAMGSAQNTLVSRGGIDGKEFSEIGQLYLGEDQKVHFRSRQKLYFFSHMYYIGEALEKSGVLSSGKISYDQPIRISGNYSKAAAVYDFLIEAPLRGHQIVWIDRVEKVSKPEELTRKGRSLFNGKNLAGWTVAPSSKADPSPWTVHDGSISSSSPIGRSGQRLMTDASYRDFELSFEYRSTWGNSASLFIRANGEGEGIGLSLDHLDGGHVGFPKSSSGTCSPLTLHETRTTIGFGKNESYRLQYDGRLEFDGIAVGKLLEICKLPEFLREWDGAYWNVVKVRCVGPEPIVTVWVNEFLICRFHAETVSRQQKNPNPIGGIKTYRVNPEGRIGFALHSTGPDDPVFALREIRLESR